MSRIQQLFFKLCKYNYSTGRMSAIHLRQYVRKGLLATDGYELITGLDYYAEDNQ